MPGERDDQVSASRRTFLKQSTAAAVSAGLAVSVGRAALARSAGGVPNAHAAGSDELRIGLIGSGGRGSGAIINALSADKNCKLTAIGDTFADVANRELAALRHDPQYGSRIAVKPDHVFVGFDAYRQVIDSGVDVVILTTPPHFRPQHLKYAIEQGKHVFAEKPVATDPTGVRSVLESCRLARQKNLCVVSGLCYRYDKPKQEIVARIHDGAVGKIVALHTAYNSGTLWHRGHNPKWSQMEYQIRNWLYFTWLSGDFICEQHVHSLDKMAWAMNDVPPQSVSSIGGRQQRTEPKYGYIYDHFCSVFTYSNGVKLFSTCRQQAGCDVDVNDYVMGTKGIASMMQATITGEKPWKFEGHAGKMYQNEHIALFKAIRSGTPINNGTYMAQSTLMGIMARMSAYSGKDVTWDEVVNSKLDLSPAKYDWIDVPVPNVAIPGIG